MLFSHLFHVPFFCSCIYQEHRLNIIADLINFINVLISLDLDILYHVYKIQSSTFSLFFKILSVRIVHLCHTILTDLNLNESKHTQHLHNWQANAHPDHDMQYRDDETNLPPFPLAHESGTEENRSNAAAIMRKE